MRTATVVVVVLFRKVVLGDGAAAELEQLYVCIFICICCCCCCCSGRMVVDERAREKREVGASHSNHHMIGGLSSPLGTTTQTDDLAKGLTVDLELERGLDPISCDVM